MVTLSRAQRIDIKTDTRLTSSMPGTAKKATVALWDKSSQYWCRSLWGELSIELTRAIQLPAASKYAYGQNVATYVMLNFCNSPLG